MATVKVRYVVDDVDAAIGCSRPDGGQAMPDGALPTAGGWSLRGPGAEDG